MPYNSHFSNVLKIRQRNHVTSLFFVFSDNINITRMSPVLTKMSLKEAGFLLAPMSKILNFLTCRNRLITQYTLCVAIEVIGFK